MPVVADHPEADRLNLEIAGRQGNEVRQAGGYVQQCMLSVSPIKVRTSYDKLYVMYRDETV